MTFINANNYGAVLQAYGLQTYLENVGNRVIFINYKYSGSTKLTFKQKLLRKIKSFLQPEKVQYIKNKQHAFSEFKKKYISITDKQYYNEVNIELSDSDIVICGSDQVWNSDLNGMKPGFYLDFSEKQKSFTYAASVGRAPLTNKDKELITEYVKDIDRVSVREQSLLEYLKSENIDSQLVCDPVFLLQKDEWSKIAKLNDKHNYILVYGMADTDELRKTVQKVSQKHNKKVYYIWGGKDNPYSKIYGEKIECYGPDEFLGCIINADLVITNSFHGAAFSMIFNKKLYVVKHTNRNDRLDNLLSISGNIGKIIDSVDFEIVNKEISGENSLEKMHLLIQSSKRYLNEVSSKNNV